MQRFAGYVQRLNQYDGLNGHGGVGRVRVDAVPGERPLRQWTLQRSKPQQSAMVVAQQKTHTAMAERAESVIQENGVAEDWRRVAGEGYRRRVWIGLRGVGAHEDPKNAAQA